MQHKKAYFWGLLNQVGPSVVSLVSTMCLTRLLTPSDYGMIGVLAIFFTIANTLIDSGLGGSLVNQISITQKDCATIATFNLVVGLVIYALLFISAPSIEHFYSLPGLAKVTRTISVMFIIYPIGLVPNALIIRNLELNKSFAITTVSAILAAIIAIILAFNGFGVYALVWNNILNSVFKVFLSCILCHYIPKFGFSFDSFRRLFSFGFYTTLTSVIDSIYGNILFVLNGKFSSIKTTGYLKQAKNAEDISLTTITGTLSSVLFPILTRKKDNVDEFVAEATDIYKKVIILVVPLLVVISIYSKEIIVLLFGSQWESAGPFLSLLMIAGIFSLLETLNRTFIKSSGRADALFHITIIKRIIGILILVVVAVVKIDWLLYAYIISTVIGFILNTFAYGKIVKKSVAEQLVNTMYLILPSAVLFVLMSIVYLLFKQILLVPIIGSILLLLIYYSLAMKHLGVTIKYLYTFIKRKNQ